MPKKSNLIKKIPTIAIKCNPPRRSRQEIIRMCNVGAAPGYETKTDGTGRSLQERAQNIRKYRDNYERIFGHD